MGNSDGIELYHSKVPGDIRLSGVPVRMVGIRPTGAMVKKVDGRGNVTLSLWIYEYSIDIVSDEYLEPDEADTWQELYIMEDRAVYRGQLLSYDPVIKVGIFYAQLKRDMEKGEGMGVNECGRRGCPEIMCDTLIETRENEYYICDSCYRELTEDMESLPGELTEEEVLTLIDDFMGTETPGKKVNPLDYLKEVTTRY